MYADQFPNKLKFRQKLGRLLEKIMMDEKHPLHEDVQTYRPGNRRGRPFICVKYSRVEELISLLDIPTKDNPITKVDKKVWMPVSELAGLALHDTADEIGNKLKRIATGDNRDDISIVSGRVFVRRNMLIEVCRAASIKLDSDKFERTDDSITLRELSGHFDRKYFDASQTDIMKKFMEYKAVKPEAFGICRVSGGGVVYCINRADLRGFVRFAHLKLTGLGRQILPGGKKHQEPERVQKKTKAVKTKTAQTKATKTTKSKPAQASPDTNVAETATPASDNAPKLRRTRKKTDANIERHAPSDISDTHTLFSDPELKWKNGAPGSILDRIAVPTIDADTSADDTVTKMDDAQYKYQKIQLQIDIKERQLNLMHLKHDKADPAEIEIATTELELAELNLQKLEMLYEMSDLTGLDVPKKTKKMGFSLARRVLTGRKKYDPSKLFPVHPENS